MLTLHLMQQFGIYWNVVWHKVNTICMLYNMSMTIAFTNYMPVAITSNDEMLIYLPLPVSIVTTSSQQDVIKNGGRRGSGYVRQAAPL